VVVERSDLGRLVLGVKSVAEKLDLVVVHGAVVECAAAEKFDHEKKLAELIVPGGESYAGNRLVYVEVVEKFEKLVAVEIFVTVVEELFEVVVERLFVGPVHHLAETLAGSVAGKVVVVEFAIIVVVRLL